MFNFSVAEWVRLAIFVLAAASIQFGGQSQIISCSFAFFIIVWSYLGVAKIRAEDAVVPLFLMLLGLLFFLDYPDIFSYLLRTCREYLVLLIYLATRYTTRIIRNKVLLAKYCLIFQCVCLIYSFFQFALIFLGSPGLFLPYYLYGNIAGEDISSSMTRVTTVPSYWLEFGMQKALVLGEEFKLRAVAFYTEPSYLASVMVAFSFMVTVLAFENKKISRVSFAITFMVCLIVQSASGILVSLVLWFFAELRWVNKDKRIYYGLISLVPISIILMIFVGERLLAISDSSSEASGYLRLVVPFIRMGELWNLGYFMGAPSGIFDEIFSPFIDGIFVGIGSDNSVLNMVLNYGIAGIILMVYFFSRFDFYPGLFVFLVGQFNGALFSYDKGVLIGSALIVYYGVKNEWRYVK